MIEDVLVPDVIVRYQDPHLMIVEKPAGLPSVPGKYIRDSLITRLSMHWPHARMVHRLDMATSGLMVIPLTAKSHALISKAFSERRVSKGYLAWVAGVPGHFTGHINFPLRCDWPRRPLQIVDLQYGKPAHTRWRLLRCEQNRALLYLKPQTGRSHQLRVHLKTLGHPILGDDFYAPPELVARAPRLLLHACLLEFHHPVTQRKLRFKSLTQLSC